MKPRETGGNIPGAKVRKKTAPRRSPAQAPAPPRTYTPAPNRPSGTARILPTFHGYAHLREKDEPSPKQLKAITRDNFARARFPYTSPLQVAYANASGDIERNILPRVTKPPTKPPTVHPGLKPGAAGYAYVGKNDIYLTPDSYLAKPDYARGVSLHEFAHTRQHPKTRLPKWVIEGGADYVAEGLAKKIGLPAYKPGYPKYLKSVKRRVRRTARHLPGQ